MSEKSDVQAGIRQVQDQVQQGVRELKEKLAVHGENMDKFVKEKPYVAIGVVFVAGLTLGILATLAARGRD